MEFLLSQKTRIKNKSDLLFNIHSLYDFSVEYVNEVKSAMGSICSKEEYEIVTSCMIENLRVSKEWTITNIEQAFNNNMSCDKKLVYHIIRLMLTGGRPFGDLHELILLFGKDNTIKKLTLFNAAVD